MTDGHCIGGHRSGEIQPIDKSRR